MPFCPNCGTKVSEGTGFCPECGRRLAIVQGVNGDNTSGQGDLAVIPDEIRGWNWGAFVLTWIWGAVNSVWIAFLVWIPVFGFIWCFFLGAKGNEWAWRKKKWDSIEHFKRTQRNWNIAGLILFVVWLIILIIAIPLSILYA
jgi:hypothetical protein